MSVTRRVDELDVSLFDQIKVGGTSPQDRRSLLALHAALATRGPFRYLEVGCYLGGTLQAFIADRRCEGIVAIDRRDEVSLDVRDENPVYQDNTTAHMVELLAGVPSADLAKLRTIDASTQELDPREFAADLCFIDAEHTNEAVLRDAWFCHSVIRDRGVIAFHDRKLVADGIVRFLSQLPGHRAYPLMHDLLVVEVGIPTLLGDRNVRRQVPRRAWLLAARLGLTRALLAATRNR